MNIPKWSREFECFTKIKSCIVIEGNIYDEYPVLEEGNAKCSNFLKLDNYIHKMLSANGYDVCFYDPVNGFYNRNKQKSVVSVFEETMVEFEENIEQLSENDRTCLTEYQEMKETQDDIRVSGQIGSAIMCDTLKASEYIKKILIENKRPSVFCLNFASQTLADPTRMQDTERVIFMNLLYASMNARRNVGKEDKIKRQNLLILIVDKVNDIPAWFYLDNPNVTINPAITHGISEYVGSVETGKVADLVLWRPDMFGVKPEMIIKNGFICASRMGDANASIPTPEPVVYTDMFGGKGQAVDKTSFTFVSQYAYEHGIKEGLGLNRNVLPVKHCRDIGKKDMVYNNRIAKLEVDPETYTVKVDGEEITCEPAGELALAQRYFLF